MGFPVNGSTRTHDMLEDDFTYVLRKALMGQAITPQQAAARAAIPVDDVLAFLDGTFNPETARNLANVLGLNADAMARHDVYLPALIDLAGVQRLDLPFGGERVNAWLIEMENTRVLFDAGFRTDDLEQALAGRQPDQVFITHSHIDHVAALGKFIARKIPVYSPDLPQTIHLAPGTVVRCGPLAMRACDLSGHAIPALGYHIDGLALPVLVTGDALFAGSMGGCKSMESYQLALARLQAVLSELPDETILLPGHGPATTLGEERRSNPFL